MQDGDRNDVTSASGIDEQAASSEPTTPSLDTAGSPLVKKHHKHKHHQKEIEQTEPVDASPSISPAIEDVTKEIPAVESPKQKQEEKEATHEEASGELKTKKKKKHRHSESSSPSADVEDNPRQSKANQPNKPILSTKTPAPTTEEQRKIISDVLNTGAQMAVNDSWFLISKMWYRVFQDYVKLDKKDGSESSQMASVRFPFTLPPYYYFRYSLDLLVK